MKNFMKFIIFNSSLSSSFYHNIIIDEVWKHHPIVAIEYHIINQNIHNISHLDQKQLYVNEVNNTKVYGECIKLFCISNITLTIK